MNKNNRKNILFTGLLSSLLLLTSCGNGNTSESSNKEKGITKIWSTYDTVKVQQNTNADVYYDVLDGKVNIQMMKNESESGQFIITPNRNISSYNVIKSSLKRVGGSEIISEDDITIYAQKYLEITKKYNLGNSSIGSGDFVPDMLLPIEKSVEYKENKIKFGNQQGITIDVKSHHDTVAGTYKGTFKVILDDETFDVPVQVTVWDIDKVGRDTIQSSFLVYKNYLLQGEYDTSEEMIYQYYDMLLDYNINTYVIRNENLGIDNVNTYVNEMYKRRENENFNSIVIPIYFPQKYRCNGGTATDINIRDNCYQYIKQLILKSTEEYSLIDMAYFYSSTFDEADAYKSTSTLYDDALEFYRKGGQLEQTLKYCQEKLEEDGVFDALRRNGESEEYINHVHDFVMNIPSVWPTTTFDDTEVDNTIVTNCPGLAQFNTGIYRQKLIDGKANSNGNLWTYTCSGPQYPYPTFHIDDYNLGTRTTGWMMKKYGINGYLYWAVNLYEPVGRFGSLDDYVEPYDSPNRAGIVPGDGFLLYPGKYYGHYGPFPTNRIMQYRDTSDDYELIGIYENLLKERANKYGISIDVNDYMDDLYDQIFSGTIYTKDDALMFRVREELARRIIALRNEDELMFNSVSDGFNYYSTIYTNQSSLEINGERKEGTKSGSGFKYEISTPVNSVKEIKIESYGYAYKYALNNSGLFIDSSSRNTPTSNSSINFVDDGIEFKVNSCYRDNGEEIGGKTQRFAPGITFKCGDLSKIQTINFKIKNTSSERIEVYFRLTNDLSNNDVESVTLAPNQEMPISINLNSLSKNFLSNITGFMIQMSNVRLDEHQNMVLYPERTFKTTNLVYVERGE